MYNLQHTIFRVLLTDLVYYTPSILCTLYIYTIYELRSVQSGKPKRHAAKQGL